MYCTMWAVTLRLQVMSSRSALKLHLHLKIDIQDGGQCSLCVMLYALGDFTEGRDRAACFWQSTLHITQY